MISCTRRLTFAAGHRVHGHESKCAHPHGHNYVAEVTVRATALDPLGRVVDFGVIKERVGKWIEEYWDHAFLIYERDEELLRLFETHPEWRIWRSPLNPTAENMAQMLAEVASSLLKPLLVAQVRIHETENCFADAVPYQ